MARSRKPRTKSAKRSVPGALDEAQSSSSVAEPVPPSTVTSQPASAPPPESPQPHEEVTCDPPTAPPPRMLRPTWTIKSTDQPKVPPKTAHHGPATSNGKASTGAGGMGIPKHCVDAEVVDMPESTWDDSQLIELRFAEPVGIDSEPKPSPGPQLVRVICPECSTSHRARLMDVRMSTNRKTKCLRCGHQFIIPVDVTTITPPPLPPLHSARTFAVTEYVEGPTHRPFELDIPPSSRQKHWLRWVLIVPAAGLIILGLYNHWWLTVDSPAAPPPVLVERPETAPSEPVESAQASPAIVPLANRSFSRVTGPPTEHH